MKRDVETEKGEGSAPVAMKKKMMKKAKMMRRTMLLHHRALLLLLLTMRLFSVFLKPFLRVKGR